MNKKIFKLKKNRCAICGENNYALLDVHRINEGKEYSEANCVALCCNCHRKHHSGVFKILEKRMSTGGMIIFVEENNEINFYNEHD